MSRGLAPAVLQDLYHYLMRVSWPQALCHDRRVLPGFRRVVRLSLHLRPGCIANLNPPGFLGDFFFSVETLATVGYGDMHPQTLYGHTVAMLEIFTDL